MKKDSALKTLIVLFLCTWVSSKDLLVSLSASNAYASLDQAIQALMSGENLAEESNTITVDSSCLSTPQQFPNTQIQGLIPGGGSISIIYSDLAHLVTQITDCDDLPVLLVNPNNPMALSNMASFSISGFNIIYTGAGTSSSIMNVETVVFSNFCFDNTELSALSSASGNSFTVSGVTEFSMKNVIYFFDAYKEFLITQTDQIIINNITVVLLWSTIDSRNAALSISNPQIYHSNSNITNMRIVCEGIPYMPNVLWVSQAYNTFISSLNVIDCTFRSEGSQSIGLFLSHCSNIFEISDALVQSLFYTNNNYHRFLSAFGTVTTTLNDFQINDLNLQLTSTSFMALTSSQECSERELYLSINNLTLSNSLLLVSGRFITAIEGEDPCIGGINLNNITIFQTFFYMYSTFFSYTPAKYFPSYSEAKLLHVKFNGLNLTNSEVSLSDVISITGGGSGTLIACLEAIRLEILNFAFVGNTVLGSGNIIQASQALTSITNLTATHNSFYASTLYKTKFPSSFFLSNSSITNLILSDGAEFISSNNTQSTQSFLEECYFNDSTEELFAQVYPFISYNNTFNAVRLQGSSSLLLSNNPHLIIKGNRFHNIAVNRSKILTFGYPQIFYSSQILLLDWSIASWGTRTPKKISIFTAVEDSLFLNDAFLYQLYKDTRSYLSLQDALNSIYFMSIVGNSFDTISTTNNSKAAVLLQNFLIPNSSIGISNNTFHNVISDGSYHLISADKLPKTYFTNHMVTNTSVQGYLITYITSSISNLLIDSTVLSGCQKLGLYELRGDQCSNISIQNNQAKESETEQLFINIACYQMTEGVIIQNSTFDSIIVKNSRSVIDTMGFIVLTTTYVSASSSFYRLKDNNFFNISLQSIQGYSTGKFQGTFLFMSSVQSSVEFLNTTFDLISIYPEGSIMEIFTPDITLSNSTFKRFIYDSVSGALNIVFKNLTVIKCIFDQNSGSGSDASGIFRFYNPDPMSEMVNVTILDSNFTNNTAPYGTIIYAKDLSIQLFLNESQISHNQATVSDGALFYFGDIYSSSISMIGANITQSNKFNVEYNVFDFDESDTNFELSNCIMTAIGDPKGNFIHVKGTEKTVSLFVDSLTYSANPFDVSIPQFGLFKGDNFNAIFENLQATRSYLSVTSMITVNCNPNTKHSNYVCNLRVSSSTFQELNLIESAIININSDSATPLTMLNIHLQFNLFSDITWISDGASSGIVRSVTNSIGRVQEGADFAINIEDCTFSKLKGAGGLIYNGVESKYDLILSFSNNSVDSVAFEEMGAVISASRAQLTYFKSDLAPTSSRNVSFLLAHNNFSNITSAQEVASMEGGGRIFYWTSQNRGVSLSLQYNNFSNINCSVGDGAIIHVAYSYNQSSVLENNDLSPEFMVRVSSENNSYKNIYAQNGAIVFSQGDTQMLQMTFQGDNMSFIHATRNGGIFNIEYASSYTNSASSSSRLLASATDLSTVPGIITISECNLQNISANNGGFIYEMSPNNSVLITVLKNSFSSVSADTRGGAFCLNQPDLTVANNTFSYISAGLAGTISYSTSDLINISNLATSNLIIPSPETSVTSYGPTNLRIALIPTVDSGVTLLPQIYEAISPNPIFLNLTSYSLSQYLISLTLVYQKDPKNLNEYETVLDESTNSSLSLRFFYNTLEEKPFQSKNCSNSICNVLASSIELKGKADEVIGVSATYTSEYFTQSQHFSFQLRGCVVGEINDTINAKCRLCESGTYSLNLNDSNCQTCPTGATCYGGRSYSIKPAYYRSTADTAALIIVPCNDTGERCLGGEYQTNCSEAYLGIVCSQCNFENGYLSTGKSGSCSQCYEKTKLISFAVLLLLASTAYQVVMIVVTYNENKNIHAQYLIDKKQQKTAQKHLLQPDSVALPGEKKKGGERQKITQEKKQMGLKPGAFIVIFTTFTQICSVLSNLDIGTANTLISTSVSVANSNAQAVFSLQCLYMLVSSDLFVGLKFETYVYVFSPIVKIALVAIFELLRNLIMLMRNHHRHKRGSEHEREESSRRTNLNSNEQRKAAASSSSSPTNSLRNRSLIRIGAVAVVLFLLEQPGIVASLCQYLTCTQLDPYLPKYFIKSRNNIECYTDEYNSFLYTVIIPALIFWAFVVPFAIFLVLYNKRKKLFKSEALRVVLGNFYNAYSKEAYYWGLVIIIFKMSIFIMDSVLTSSLISKGIVFMMVIHAYHALFRRKPPYNHDYLNRAEKYCTLAYMTVLTMVFIRMSTEATLVNKFCDVLILVCMVGSGGYVLTNVFWLYIIKGREVLEKIKQMKIDKEILKETLRFLKNYHSEIVSKRSQETNPQKRRFGISVELPRRLRGSDSSGTHIAETLQTQSRRLPTFNPKSDTLTPIPDISLISVNSSARTLVNHTRFEEIEMKKIEIPDEIITTSKRKQDDTISNQRDLDRDLSKHLDEPENQAMEIGTYFL